VTGFINFLELAYFGLRFKPRLGGLSRREGKGVMVELVDEGGRDRAVFRGRFESTGSRLLLGALLGLWLQGVI
jgi:hypothetical protein